MTNFKRPILDKSGTYVFLLVMTLEEMLATVPAEPEPQDKKITPQVLAERPWLAKITREAPDRAAYELKVGRRPDGTWAPGLSPNPGGRPLGPVRLIEYLTGGGESLIVQAVDVVEGRATATVINKFGEPIEVGPSLADKAEARKYLSDRLWGKSVDRIAVAPAVALDEEVVDAATMSNEEWKILARARVARTLKNTLEKSQDIEDAVLDSAE